MQNCTIYQLWAIVMEKMRNCKLVFCAAVGTFVKGLVELIVAVAAADFDNDFFFHDFFSNWLLLSLKKRWFWS